jgi:hypothetical protein
MYGREFLLKYQPLFHKPPKELLEWRANFEENSKAQFSPICLLLSYGIDGYTASDRRE